MHYLFRYEGFSEKEALQIGRPEAPNDNLECDNGVFIEPAPKKVRFVMAKEDRGELGDQVLTALPGLVVSAKIRQVLEAAGVDNMQYFPAEILDEKTQHLYTDYFVANIIGVVDCIDMAKTKLTFRAGGSASIRSIDDLRIDEMKARDLPIFRLARRTTLVLINEAVKNALEKAKLRGVGLPAADGFST